MKKVCINFVGQPKYLYNLHKVFENHIYSPEYEYHILYTTWIDQNINEVKQICPNIFIKKINKPNIAEHPYYNIYINIINNYKYDETNIINGKKIDNYFLSQFIRDQSRYTIEDYENKNSINFDIIITTRLDINIQHANISSYFNTILNNNEHVLYVGNEPKYDLYNKGAYPDALIMGKRDIMLYLLNYIHILKFCAIDDNIFHPETTSYKITIYKNIKLIYLPFYAFIFDCQYVNVAETVTLSGALNAPVT